MWALISGGLVTVLSAAAEKPGDEWIDCGSAIPGIGWSYSSGIFTEPPGITISSADFVARFTADEQVAVQQAANTNAQIGVGLTTGLAIGRITLTDTVTTTWMAALVTAGAITQERATAILTP